MPRYLFSVPLAVVLAVGITLHATRSLAAPPPSPSPRLTAATTAIDAPGLGVLIRFRQSHGASLGAGLIAGVTGSAATTLDAGSGLYQLKTPTWLTDGQYAAQLTALASGLAYAEPDYLRQPATYSPPADPSVSDTTAFSSGNGYYLGARHWWLDAMHAQEAWALGQGVQYPLRARSDDIKIAVIDTGVFLSHPDLAGGQVVAGLDECASLDPRTGMRATDLDVTPDATDDAVFRGHGTAVTAVLGARCNGAGMVGIAWNPTILVYKVAGPLAAPTGSLPAGAIVIPSAAVARAIRDAVDAGCRVINVSLCGSSFSAAEQDAVDYAQAHGAVVCASVGNDGDTKPRYPAACTGCLGVGAVERLGGTWTSNGSLAVASWSSRPAGVVDLVAPGAVIWSATGPSANNDGYTYWQGTSFSSPTVAGAIAYLWRAMPDLSSEQIVAYLTRTATDVGPTGRDDASGFGLPNLGEAYRAMIADWPMLDAPTITTRFVGKDRRIAWTPVRGSDVAYRVTVDGTPAPAQPGTSVALDPGTADGTHTITVQAWSARNWSTASTARQEVVLDTQQPRVSGFRVSGGRVCWEVDDASPCEMRARIDSATPSLVGSATLAVEGLEPGAHTVSVSVEDAAGNVSAPADWAFAVPSGHAYEATASLPATQSAEPTGAPPASAAARHTPVLGPLTARTPRGQTRTVDLASLVRWPVADHPMMLRFEAQRWERCGRGHRWVTRATKNIRVTPTAGSGTRIRARLSLPRAGQWRMRVITADTPIYAGAISSARMLHLR